jgi:phosphoribosylformylglycinamidine synthase subunit PurL
MVFDSATLQRHGVTPDEYARIVELVGREPNLLELGLFSVMWSEHCSYKSSRVHLKTLPTEGARVDIGDGLAAVFKIESHNHPSFIEPYQGAATGVGGIIRDIFTMGARPIALLDSLRFGPVEDPANRRVVRGVVAGIGGYGNSMGIPTIGGEVMFDETYSGNPLVNVFCLGIARHDALVKGQASGVGNPVYYVGAKTGRDGIHGATMASAEFDETSADKRPAVQVGDPFMEKLLLEACLEVMQTDACVGVQDMGAAGLTCATSETGSRGEVGVEIDVMHVPQREAGMTPYEIMLSESQERMLLIVHKGREAEVERIFEKWDLHAVRIGEVTADKMLRIRDHGTLVAEVPNRALTDEGPVYRRPFAPPADMAARQRMPSVDATQLPVTLDALLRLLASPGIASKRWIYRQFDHMVRTNTIVLTGLGAGVVRVKGTNRALAMSLDGNGRFCQLDPRQGARLAVAESARNVACAGAEPIGATNCLNFGNPERPEIMWQFAEAVAGIGEACVALGTPITGGNVSLYNETAGAPILPTPVIGVVGVLEDASHVRSRVFQDAGLDIVLLGENHGELGGSAYLTTFLGTISGVPPALNLAAEGALQRFLVAEAGLGAITSAHDCSDGGFVVALAECCFDSGGIGADVDVPAASGDGEVGMAAATLFGESATRVILGVKPEASTALLERARSAGVAAQRVGATGGTQIRVAIDGVVAIECPVSEAEDRWTNGFSQWLESPPQRRG